MKTLCVALLVGVGALSGAPALAQSMLSFSAGQIGVADELTEPQWYGVEWHGETLSWGGVVPGAGYHRAACGATYDYADFRKYFWLSPNWALTPHFGPGVFHDSDQVKLGHTIQFRSGIELTYRMPNDIRIGLGISHLSNGSLGDLNPGTEAVDLTFSMPL